MGRTAVLEMGAQRRSRWGEMLRRVGDIAGVRGLGTP